MTSDDGRAARLGLSALSQLVESALDGIAVIDPGSKAYIYVNPAGCRLLGRDSRELSGHCASPFNTVREATSTESNRALENLLYGALEFECTTSLIEADDGDLLVVRFRDVTEARLQQRRLNTFSRTSASIAFAGSLRTVLDRLADDVRQATGMVACTFLLMNETGDLRQAGTSGDYPNVDDYNERLKACRDLGAPLLAIEAFESHAPLISVGWREKTLADSRFAPLHDISRDANWHSIAVVPLVVRDRILGVFNGFYLNGHEPGASDLTFLCAIADQAAVAVENARLLAEVESTVALQERHHLARELHDSVSQALFSLTLQTRAVQLSLRQEPFEPDLVATGLDEIRELTRGALAEMRALIFQLRPAALHEEGLVSAVRKHAAAVSAKEGLEVTVTGPDEILTLDPQVEAELFRVIQEAMHNTVKHAHARAMSVAITPIGPAPADLVIEVTDDGDGFDVLEQHPGHLGLQSMAERMQHLGGSLRVDSRPGFSTTVRAVVPDPGHLRSTAGKLAGE